MKKLFSLILCLCLTLCMTATSYASNTSNYTSMNNETLATLIGTTTDDIAYLKEVYGDQFNQVIDEYLNNTSAPDTSQGSLGLDAVTTRVDEITGNVEYRNPNTRMSESNIEWIQQYLTKGMIIITKDAKNGIRHGHAGLVYTKYRSIEALGPNQPSQLCNINYWTTFNCMRALKPKDTSNMSAAGNYAYDHLRGWEYSALAPVTSTTKMNCANLVWKAYDAQGQDILGYAVSGYFLPVMFDSSSKLIGVANVG